MSEQRPVSAFGRSLVDRGNDWTECVICGDDGRADEMLVGVLVVETEARAAALRELREEVAGLHVTTGEFRTDNFVDRAAVLAAIDGKLEENR